MKIASHPRELVGNTPLYELRRLSRELGLTARVLAKLEFMNPGGSVKDRAALYMLDDAKSRGLIGDSTVIIEPTSGNTGIGLAVLCAAEGRRLILTMPDTMSDERRRLFAAYGAELVLTPGADGMKGSIAKAESLARELGDSFIPSQFDNAANAKAHYEATAEEIIADADRVDVFVAAVGTGGTLTGTARKLKETFPNVRIVAVEPDASPLLSKGEAGPHKIQGIGANFVPSLLDRSLIDEVMTVTDADAYEYCRRLARTEGILVGVSSGAAMAACARLAGLPEYSGKTIVTVFPDTGMRYLSTPDLF